MMTVADCFGPLYGTIMEVLRAALNEAFTFLEAGEKIDCFGITAVSFRFDELKLILFFTSFKDCLDILSFSLGWFKLNCFLDSFLVVMEL